MFNWISSRRLFLLGAIVVAVVAAGVLAAVFALPSVERPAPKPRDYLQDGAGPPKLTTAMEQRVEVFCGDCHSLPRPERFARDRWHYEVRRGYEFYAASGRNDLDPPPLSQSLAYYRARAPVEVTFPEAKESTDALGIRFQREDFVLNSGLDVLPEVAHLRWARLAPNETVLLASDIRYGHVVAIDLRRQNRKPPRVLGQLRNPCRVDVGDLDDDGLLDIVVADLGSYLPADHNHGQVVLLKRQPAAAGYEAIPLLTELGRVSDVRAVDVDGDSRRDLLIAEFGWRSTGRLLLARNVSAAGESPRFELIELDDRPGAIDIRPYDFNHDGRLDFAAMFSQEFEAVDLFLNRGIPDWRRPTSPLPFARYNVWTAPDLTFGSSGIELVDLNGDDRVDILYTNGDTFDNDYVVPGHGVQWLENLGGQQFAHRRLTEMPGAYRAMPGDFDNDGDLDIVAVARLPANRRPGNLPSPLASIVLLKQTAAGVFARHTLEWDSPYYPTLEVADFDGNGYPDFAVAAGPYVAELRQQQRQSHYLTVWWNEGASGR